MKSIQEFQLDPKPKNCSHYTGTQFEKFDNLDIKNCDDCGMVIITYCGPEDKRTFYISPYDVWKLFNYKFDIME